MSDVSATDQLVLRGEGRAFGNPWRTLRAGKRLVNDGQNYSHAEGLAFDMGASPGAGPELAERLERFGAKS